MQRKGGGNKLGGGEKGRERVESGENTGERGVEEWGDLLAGGKFGTINLKSVEKNGFQKHIF